jgi:hypothetical protein
MKTSRVQVSSLLDINKYACDELISYTVIKTGFTEYDCTRLSGHACYGGGWCPLRYTKPEFTPKMSSDGTHWRFY